MAMLHGMAVAPLTPTRGAPPSSRADRCFTSVCNMSLVHMSCHAQATRADRSLKVPRLEWDGASLRNQNTRCNNLLPVRGPQTPAHMYSEYTERYWANIALLGRHEGSRFRMMSHDVRLLLQRLASGASFSVDSGGGSAHSNAKLLPFLLQMGYQCLGDTSTSTWRQASTALAKHLSRWAPQPATATASPGGGAGGGILDAPDYYAVATLWFPAKWRAHKGALLLAMVAQALRASRIPMEAERWWEADGGTAALEVCRVPMTLMAFLARMHSILHPSPPAAAAAVTGQSPGSSSSGSAEASQWTLEADGVQEKLRTDHVSLMEQCDGLVDMYQDELAVSESIIELLDVGELLQDISPPGDVDAFLAAAAAAAAAMGGPQHLHDGNGSA